MKRSLADEILPSEPTQTTVDPSNLAIMLIAEPKWGKTHFFMSNPNCVLLAFEEGHKFQRGYKIIIDKWDQRGKRAIKKDKEGCPHMTFMQAVDVLESSKKFDFIVIDTADMMAKMCMDFFAAKKNVEHISDIGQYGKGWEMGLATPVRQTILRLMKTGRGIGFITHTKTEISRFTDGDKARKESTLSGSVMRLLAAQSDLILHGEWGKRYKGAKKRDRIMVCDGSEDILAGNRSGAILPERFVLNQENGWGQFTKFFADESYADKAERIYRKRTGRSK